MKRWVTVLSEGVASNTANSIRVLLVDDEESQMELTKLNLEFADPAFKITIKLKPLEALELITIQPFDCIVSDYQMQGMNGIQFCAEVRKTSTIPFIIYTGRGSEEVASDAFAAGVDDYVRKESELSHYKVLAKRIRHAVEKRRAEEALFRTKALGEEEISKMRDLRRSGIELIGDVPWGTHFCQFYKTKQDLLDTLVPYFKAGLEGNEFCMWVTAEPLTEGEARKAMEDALPGFQGYIDAGQIEIIPYGDWYLRGGSFESSRVLQGWIDKLNAAQKRGYAGLRLTGNTFWLEREQWDAFTDYEEEVNSVIGQYKMIALCTYSLDKCNAEEVIDVVKNHQFALIKREGRWVLIESKEQKEALAALRVSEENYRRLFTSMTDGFAYHQMIYNDEGKPIDYVFLDVNDAFTRLTGLIRDEILGKRVTEVIPGIVNDPNKLIEVYGKTAKTGEPVRLEINFEPLHRWYSIYAYSPQSDHFVALFSDISDKKKFEEEMKRLASFPQLNPNPILEADYSGNIHYLNPAATSLFPIVSRIRSMSPLLLDWGEIVARMKHEGKVLMRDVNVNGVWYSLSLHLVPDMERVRVYALNIEERVRGERALRDANEELSSSNEELAATEEELRTTNEELYASNEELQTTEEELRVSNESIQENANRLENMVQERAGKLRESEERLRMFMDSSEEGYSLYDSELRLLDLNRTALSRLPAGTRKEDLVGRKITEIYPGIESSQWYPVYLEVLRTGKTYHGEGRSVPIQGGILLSASIFKVGEGLGVISRDISEFKELEDRLQRSEVISAVEQMGATVAHDLRGPLGLIVQSINMIKQDPSLTPRMHQLIEENAIRSLKMIADWRSSTRQIVAQPVKTNFSGLIKHVLEGTAIPGTINVITSVGDELEVVVDPDIMHRVLDNLLKNAVEAMPQGGKLSVSAEKEVDNFVIKVADTGFGIPEELRGRIFSPLYTTKVGGMGLGLTYCRRAVEAMGGTIDFKSRVGEGTTFTIKLPLFLNNHI